MQSLNITSVKNHLRVVANSNNGNDACDVCACIDSKFKFLNSFRLFRPCPYLILCLMGKVQCSVKKVFQINCL
jgi:hypothetical protein